MRLFLMWYMEVRHSLMYYLLLLLVILKIKNLKTNNRDRKKGNQTRQ